MSQLAVSGEQFFYVFGHVGEGISKTPIVATTRTVGCPFVAVRDSISGMNRLTTLCALVLVLVTPYAHAASYQITGTIVQSEGVLDALVPLGGAVSGIIEIDDSAIATGLADYSDIGVLEISYGELCLSISACPGPLPPFTSGSAAISVSASGEIVGGYFDAIILGPTDLNLLVYLDFDLLSLDVIFCGLGCDVGNYFTTSSADLQIAQIVPVPASIWFFALALASLWGMRR